MNLDYRIVYSNRKTLALIVERDSSILVRAPIGTTTEQIQRAVEAKSLWLYQKVNHKQKYPIRPRRKEFVTGESLLYLGRHYRLELTDDNLPGVRFDAGFFMSRVHQPIAAHLLREWYIQRAREKLTPRVKYFARSLGVAHNQILISDLKFRWGSCTPNSNLNFNWRIIKAPTFVIDYLVVHELAHLLESNHGERFWNIVAVQVPRYERARDWLRNQGALLEEDL